MLGAEINHKEDEGDYFVIRGETRNGKKFRPSDWCDRLHCTLRALGDESDYYAEFVHIANLPGGKCLIVNTSLKDINAILYNFFVNFAADNNLTTEFINKTDLQGQQNQTASQSPA